MPSEKINGITLFYEISGSTGEPLVLVHGSWGDHHNWDSVVPELSKTFRVLTYDRRGHSKSERLDVQGNIEEDVSDLIALVEFLGLSPAHIAGNSGGASVVLRTAIRKPTLFKTLIVHEPALFGVLKDIDEAKPMLREVQSRVQRVVDLLAKGENAKAAELFVETIAMGEGAWKQLPPEARETFVYNAPTFYDETNDPLSLEIDLEALSAFDKPALLSNGTKSAPFFPMVINKLVNVLPNARRITIEGAGHVPHMSHPKEYVDLVQRFCLSYS